MKFRFLLLSIALVALTFDAGAQSKSIKKLDKIFEQALVDFNVPGMAIAIVKDGEVVLSKGYGTKNINTGDPVDENTLFAIASNTKAFTSAALATLVDDGLLSWDDRVVDHLPYFEMYSAHVTQEFTVRDLLCHRSGLATFSGDLLWYGTSHSREEVIKRARFLEPVRGFREGYGYQNIMFLAAGQIVQAVTGISWDDYIKQNFLGPLGMDNTNTSIRDFNAKSNIAVPHNESNGKNHAINWVNWDNIAPAGSINSSVQDLTNWMKLQLGGGMKDSVVFWSETQHNEMWTVQTPKSVSSWSKKNMPSRSFAGYGLGWDLYNYHGRKIVNHGGGYDGMISRTVLVPEEGLGIVILTNNISSLAYALSNVTLDELLNPKEEGTDWLKMFLEYKSDGEKRTEEALEQAEEDRIKDTKPSLELAAYAGTYTDKMYGDLVVRVIGDQLSFQFLPTALFRGTLRHWHYDTFQLNWGSQMMLPSGMVQFVLGVDGKVKELEIDVPNPDFDFGELHFKKGK